MKQLQRIVTLLALVALVTISMAPQAVRAQEQNVEPDVGPPGTVFSFFATGFDDDDERVGYWVNASDGSLVGETGAVISNDERADWDWEAPSDVAPGTYNMVAEGADSGYQVIIPFEIVSVQAPAPVTPVEGGAANVEPDVGAPGTEFAFFAEGFESNRRVAYWVNTPTGEIINNDALYATSANDEGRADWSWESPADAAPGMYQMVAQGQAGNQVVIPFEIVAAGAPGGAVTPPTGDADQGVNPSVGAPGTEFTFFAEGFEPNRRVAYWVNTPSGEIISDEDLYATSANDEGRADWSWESPTDAAPGVYQMVAQGQDGVQQVISFEIR